MKKTFIIALIFSLALSVSNVFASDKEERWPKIIDEKIISLNTEEMEIARYTELSKDLRINPKYNKAEMKFQWKGTAEKGYNEDEHSIIAIMELLEDNTLELKGKGWKSSIPPDGKINGNMPSKLVDFLSYYKRERKVEFLGEIIHEENYIKKGFGEGGHAIITSPIY